MLQLKKTIIGT